MELLNISYLISRLTGLYLGFNHVLLSTVSSGNRADFGKYSFKKSFDLAGGNSGKWNSL